MNIRRNHILCFAALFSFVSANTLPKPNNNSLEIGAVASEIQDDLLKIQTKVNRLNLAVLTQPANLIMLQQEFSAIDRELATIQKVYETRDKNHVSSAFVQSLHDLLQVQLKASQDIVRRKIEESSNHCKMPAIVENIRARDFEKAEKKILEIGNEHIVRLIVEEVYDNEYKNFQLVLEFANTVENTTFQELVLSELWNRISANAHFDPNFLITLLKIINDENGNGTKEFDISLPVPDIVEQLLRVCSEHFKEALLEGSQLTDRDEHVLPHSLFFLDNSLYNEAMHRAIDAVYWEITNAKLIENIYFYGHFYYGEMLNPLAYAYGKIQKSGRNDGAVTFTLARYLHLISKFSTFREIHEIDKISFDKILAAIPVSVRNLFFEPRVCIRNELVGEYIFIENNSSSGNGTLRHVRTSICETEIDRKIWSINCSDDRNSNELILDTVEGDQLAVAKSDENNPVARVVVATGNMTDHDSLIRFNLQTDAITMKIGGGGGRYLCADSKVNDNRRRFLVAMKFAYPDMPLCRWTVDVC